MLKASTITHLKSFISPMISTNSKFPIIYTNSQSVNTNNKKPVETCRANRVNIKLHLLLDSRDMVFLNTFLNCASDA